MVVNVVFPVLSNDKKDSTYVDVDMTLGENWMNNVDPSGHRSVPWTSYMKKIIN